MAGALVIGGTKNDWEAMAVFLLNFTTVMPDLVDNIIVFHDGITSKQQEQMKKISNIEFVRYKCPVPKWKCLFNKSVRFFSSMVFCKYECLRLLENYDYIIWSDYDVVIKEDILELVNTKNGFMTVCNEEIPLKNNFFSEIKNKKLYEYNLMAETICTPLFIVRKNIGDFKKYYDWCYKKTSEFIKDLYLPEQAIITMLVQTFNISYENIERRIYCSYPSDDASDIKIIHAYGQPKFWNGLDNDLWNRYYKNWQEIKIKDAI